MHRTSRRRSFARIAVVAAALMVAGCQQPGGTVEEKKESPFATGNVSVAPQVEGRGPAPTPMPPPPTPSAP
jgi:hypothetical protein